MNRRIPKPSRRHLLLGSVAAATLTAMRPLYVSAQGADFPTKPINFIIPYSAGGPTDVAGRAVAAEMAAFLKQPVVVENRPGASGAIALEAIAKSPPDGYTIGIGNIGQLAVLPAVKDNVPWDPIKDFTVIGGLVVIELIIVARLNAPFNTFPELLAYAKANPGKVSYSISGGAGTSIHLAMEYLKNIAGINMVGVPYKGDAPAMTDLLGGHVDIGLVSTSVALPSVQSGKVKALAATSPQRSKMLPNLPRASESGLAFEAYSWSALIGPAGMPQPILDKLNAAMNAALKKPSIAESFQSQGLVIMGGTPATGRAFVQAEHDKWGKVARDGNIKVKD